MEQLTDLKAILHSKRANIYYLEKCRVMQKDGRVLYLTPANLDDVYRRAGGLEMSLMFTDTALQAKLSSRMVAKELATSNLLSANRN
jgi:hypothetical protein